MKKIFFGLLILSSISIFAVFVSCDSDKVLSPDRFVGEWIQDALETKIVITTPGAFTINSIDEDFEGVKGTYVTTSNGATIKIEGMEGEYSLILLEKDVFKIELPDEMGGDVFFVKHRDVQIDFTGTWQNSDKSITAQIDDKTNSLIVTIGSGLNPISINGNYEEDDNAFIMFMEEEDIDYDFFQEIGSGVVAVSGNAYVFCMDAQGDWSSTILSKVED